MMVKRLFIFNLNYFSDGIKIILTISSFISFLGIYHWASDIFFFFFFLCFLHIKSFFVYNYYKDVFLKTIDGVCFYVLVKKILMNWWFFLFIVDFLFLVNIFLSLNFGNCKIYFIIFCWRLNSFNYLTLGLQYWSIINTKIVFQCFLFLF